VSPSRTTHFFACAAEFAARGADFADGVSLELIHGTGEAGTAVSGLGRSEAGASPGASAAFPDVAPGGVAEFAGNGVAG
jgi:hypothetical protein